MFAWISTSKAGVIYMFLYWPPSKETDRIEYNSDGEILSWAIWSDLCADYILVPIENIKAACWHSKIEKAYELIDRELFEKEQGRKIRGA